MLSVRGTAYSMWKEALCPEFDLIRDVFRLIMRFEAVRNARQSASGMGVKRTLSLRRKRAAVEMKIGAAG